MAMRQNLRALVTPVFCLVLAMQYYCCSASLSQGGGSEAVKDNSPPDNPGSDAGSDHNRGNESSNPATISKEENRSIEGTMIFSYDFGIDEVERLAKYGVKIGDESRPQYIYLEQGNILVNPEKTIVIDTHLCKVSIGAGSVVFLMKSANDVIVYVFQTAPAPKQVMVMVGKAKVAVEPGLMFVVTTQDTADFEKLQADCHAIVYASPQLVDLRSAGLKGFSANFSIISALAVLEPLKRLTVSRNQQDRLTLERVMSGASSEVLGKFNQPKPKH